MVETQVTAGERIIEQGEDGDNFYIVQSGKYGVYLRQVRLGIPDTRSLQRCMSHFVAGPRWAREDD